MRFSPNDGDRAIIAGHLAAVSLRGVGLVGAACCLLPVANTAGRLVGRRMRAKVLTTADELVKEADQLITMAAAATNPAGGDSLRSNDSSMVDGAALPPTMTQQQQHKTKTTAATTAHSTAGTAAAVAPFASFVNPTTTQGSFLLRLCGGPHSARAIAYDVLAVRSVGDADFSAAVGRAFAKVARPLVTMAAIRTLRSASFVLVAYGTLTAFDALRARALHLSPPLLSSSAPVASGGLVQSLRRWARTVTVGWICENGIESTTAQHTTATNGAVGFYYDSSFRFFSFSSFSSVCLIHAFVTRVPGVFSTMAVGVTPLHAAASSIDKDPTLSSSVSTSALSRGLRRCFPQLFDACITNDAQPQTPSRENKTEATTTTTTEDLSSRPAGGWLATFKKNLSAFRRTVFIVKTGITFVLASPLDLLFGAAVPSGGPWLVGLPFAGTWTHMAVRIAAAAGIPFACRRLLNTYDSTTSSSTPPQTHDVGTKTNNNARASGQRTTTKADQSSLLVGYERALRWEVLSAISLGTKALQFLVVPFFVSLSPFGFTGRAQSNSTNTPTSTSSAASLSILSCYKALGPKEALYWLLVHDIVFVADEAVHQILLRRLLWKHLLQPWGWLLLHKPRRSGRGADGAGHDSPPRPHSPAVETQHLCSASAVMSSVWRNDVALPLVYILDGLVSRHITSNTNSMCILRLVSLGPLVKRLFIRHPAPIKPAKSAGSSSSNAKQEQNGVPKNAIGGGVVSIPRALFSQVLLLSMRLGLLWVNLGLFQWLVTRALTVAPSAVTAILPKDLLFYVGFILFG